MILAVLIDIMGFNKDIFSLVLMESLVVGGGKLALNEIDKTNKQITNYKNSPSEFLSTFIKMYDQERIDVHNKVKML